MVSHKCLVHSHAGYIEHDNHHAGDHHGKNATYCDRCKSVVYHNGDEKSSIELKHINDLPLYKKNDKKDKKDKKQKKDCKFKKPKCKLCY